MGRRAVRSLVLPCSLLWALPQGWCCMFATQTPHATATPDHTTTAPAHAGGCPCCPHRTDRDPAPTDKPSAPPIGYCCCSDRNATLPSTPSVERVDTGFAVILPVDALPTPLALTEEGIASVLP